jgi:hypothetical protein
MLRLPMLMLAVALLLLQHEAATLQLSPSLVVWRPGRLQA